MSTRKFLLSAAVAGLALSTISGTVVAVDNVPKVSTIPEVKSQDLKSGAIGQSSDNIPKVGTESQIQGNDVTSADELPVSGDATAGGTLADDG